MGKCYLVSQEVGDALLTIYKNGIAHEQCSRAMYLIREPARTGQPSTEHAPLAPSSRRSQPTKPKSQEIGSLKAKLVVYIARCKLPGTVGWTGASVQSLRALSWRSWLEFKARDISTGHAARKRRGGESFMSITL